MSDTAADIASGVAHTVGSVVVGPLVAGALDAPDVRRSVRELTVTVGLGLGAAVAVGVVLGLWLGRRV